MSLRMLFYYYEQFVVVVFLIFFCCFWDRICGVRRRVQYVENYEDVVVSFCSQFFYVLCVYGLSSDFRCSGFGEFNDCLMQFLNLFFCCMLINVVWVEGGVFEVLNFKEVLIL